MVPMIEPIEITTVLNTTPEAAFRAFTANVAAWWPVATHSIAGGRVSIEPGVGGRIMETPETGPPNIWGRITEWTEFSRIRFTWYVGEGPDNGTDVLIEFLPTDDGRIGVTLIHSGWEHLAPTALTRHGNYTAGWTKILSHSYAAYVARTCPPVLPHP
ncbi:SRPBCC domain-containing protein [Flavimaricola marinus]|uniref:Activator of Hsp90 ATPase homologue 1/2-like C-terminal domain-containing protein n=1 Tax=Flavimaricola marinus TaxID=1819565 RepID=A0A238LG73_9RHOB|nr:SRPBCC domain-containing protein [Flavimaricola marinus]SMY08679.1 hypothetical protein LOM8899_02834 [Flavimaricola marinus]